MDIKMTPARKIKEMGLPSLQYVADKTGWHRDTIHEWYYTNYDRFLIVVHGVKVLKNNDKEERS